MKLEIYNYDKNWDKVLPIIKEPEVQEVLNECILDYLEQGYGWNDSLEDWNTNHAPWKLIRNDYHVMRIDELIDKDVESVIFYELNDNEELSENQENAYLELYERLFKKYQPKESDIEFYQLIGGCHWLADWQDVIARKLFPNAYINVFWMEEHSFAFAVENDTLIIFDILNFRGEEYSFNHVVKELLDHLEQKNNLDK